MAASFKIPTSVKGKAKKDPGLPKFDWKPFEKEKSLSCDDEFDFASFADLLPTCAKDVVEGLKYFHSKNIAGTRI
ncbi:Hypothetical predicted protein [Paramuricea clavata]|uniref:Uncharacterized protein n=1 Tax=Paramuricea clavata TaxID=317549 RepID=A0A7D9D8K8_PARCT|nr:Hypothetical predicted protein [Paramuricea clavata]